MIIFINGSINSGKSTISKLLQERLSKTAIVEIDSLRSFIDWMPLEEAIPINLRNAVSVIMNFVQEELNVIIPYPLSQENYEYFSKELKSLDQEIIFITLSPKLEKALENRGNRQLDSWEKQRIKHHYDIGIHQPKFGIIIDNSDQSPEQTVEEIMQKLKVL